MGFVFQQTMGQNNSPILVISDIHTVPEQDEVNVQTRFTIQYPESSTVSSLSDIEQIQIFHEGDPTELENSSFSVSNDPIYVAFSFDTSGSMTDKIDSMRRAAIQAVDSAPSNVYFSIDRFDSALFNVLNFTNDHPTVISTIEAIEVDPDGGTRLYDGIGKAAEIVEAELVNNPQGVGAVILFTDGQDECTRGRGDTCSQNYDLQAVQALPIPIYTIGIEGDLGVDPIELRQISEKTGGVSRTGSIEDTPIFFGDVTQTISYQFVANALVYPQKGTNNGEIVVELSNGSSIRQSFVFESEQDYFQSEESPTIVTDTFDLIDVVITEREGQFIINLTDKNLDMVSRWRVRIINSEGKAIRENSYTSSEIPFRLNQEDLVPNTQYTIECFPIDDNGKEITSSDGLPLKLSQLIEYRSNTLSPVIEGVDIEVVSNGDLLISPKETNGEVIGRYELVVFNKDNKEIGRFIPILEKRDDGSNLLKVSLESVRNQIQPERYTLQLIPFNKNNLQLPSFTTEFDYEQPPCNMLCRFTRSGRSTLPFLLLLLGAVFAGLAIYFWQSERGHVKRVDTQKWRNEQLERSVYSTPEPKQQTYPVIGPSKLPQDYKYEDKPNLFSEPISSNSSTFEDANEIGKETLYDHTDLFAYIEIISSPSFDKDVKSIGVDLMEGEEFVMGRNRNLPLSFPNDQRVSRNHATIRREGDRFYLIDLQSGNGTYLDDQKLAKGGRERISDGAMIRLGRTTTLRFRLG